MSLIQVTLPLGAFDRLVRGIDRIADVLERQFPSPLTEEDLRLQAPTSGVTVVTDEMLLEEEARDGLRRQGYLPDDIERMIHENVAT
jgi:hypothetical protein